MKRSEKLDFQNQPSRKPDDVNGEPQPSNRKDTSQVTKSLDPTRYGDWEKNGRCIDF